MSKDFSNITILGGGLLGGSLALAAEIHRSSQRVTLWARKPETVTAAQKLGIHHATCDLAAAVNQADLLVLAVPVGAMPDLVSAALAAGLPPACLITDVGSVKRMPHETITPLLVHSGNTFIGSHPMAGSERNGIEAIAADLFENAACLLTHGDQASAVNMESLEKFWQSVGCRTSWMSAADHDALVARISHLPHIIAAAAARVCLENPADGAFGGGGLRDTTRVASGNPEMWAEILTENREALLHPLRESLDSLKQILFCLENADQEATRQWLLAAKNRRDSINPSI